MLLQPTKYQRKNFVTTTVLMACKNRSRIAGELSAKTMTLPAPAVTAKSLKTVLNTTETKN